MGWFFVPFYSKLDLSVPILASVTRRTMGKCAKETLDNPADPRHNGSMIAGSSWVDGRQSTRIW